MAAQLNIKDPATIDLARALAKRSGKSVTATIRDALVQADSDRQSALAAQVTDFMAALRRNPIELPVDLVGKSARQIVQEFHEQEWQEQFGPDEWS